MDCRQRVLVEFFGKGRFFDIFQCPTHQELLQLDQTFTFKFLPKTFLAVRLLIGFLLIFGDDLGCWQFFWLCLSGGLSILAKSLRPYLLGFDPLMPPYATSAANGRPSLERPQAEGSWAWR